MAEILESLEDWQAGRSVVDCNKFMLQNEINCDVTFLLGQKKESIKAHKYMLVSRSSVFQSIFCGSLANDSRSDTIPVSDIDLETFRALLLFLYCEEADVKASNVKKLLYAAKKYAVKGLVDTCLSFLESSINVQNVCNILEQVHLYDGKNLEAKCMAFIYDHAEDVLKSQAFTSLCPSCVDHIVKADELVVKERLVYEAGMKWADKECKRRNLEVTDGNLRTVLGNILFHVRFPLLDPVYFTNAVSTRELLDFKEIIAIYQYYNGRAQPSNWKFCVNRRRGFSLSSVIRYNLISTEGFHRPKSGECDSIKFTCSEPILLHGASMYGSLDESADYDVKIELWLCSEDENEQLSSNFVTLSTSRSQHMYDVMFTAPMALSPGKQYKISVEMNGPPTKLGYGGKTDVIADGVNFHFMTEKGGKTTSEKGQIPGLLFTQPDV